MNELVQQQKMTSLQIAEVMERNHKEVLRTIRNMEVAWKKVGGRSFALTSYHDKQGKEKPMYELTKTECLYIATKFNDEARARLVLRWEEMEIAALQQSRISTTMIASMVEEAVGRALSQRKLSQPMRTHANDLCTQSHYSSKVIADSFDISVTRLYKILQSVGMICRRENGIHYLKKRYALKGLIVRQGDIIPVISPKETRLQSFYWTEKGRTIIYDILMQHNISPLLH